MLPKPKVMLHELKQPIATSGKVWRHPNDREAVIPISFAAALAVMQMGVSDLSQIARAVDLDPKTIEHIDAAQDSRIRRVAVLGIPCGEYFRLRQKIRCPHCSSLVQTAPCVACSHRALG